MRVTKRAKAVVVRTREIKSYISSYTCPTCKVSFEGGGPDSNVVRFICRCGQELKVTK
jgi:hypothetical protein